MTKNNMTKHEKLEMLNEAYRTALSSGQIHNKKEFAQLSQINASTLSAAFGGNERYLTDSLALRAKAAAEKLQLDTMFPSIVGTVSAERIPTIPVIPTDAMAGTLTDFAAAVESYDCERILSPIKGADYAMKVCGESMSPEFPNGCQILIKRINERAFIEWGKVYVLDTENGAVIKQIRKTDRDNVVECVSLNPAYQPFTVETSYIKGWYRVLMVLSMK